MSFSFSEIINSIFCAIIYGVGYFLLFTAGRIIISRSFCLKAGFLSIFKYENITEQRQEGGIAVFAHPFLTFLDFLTFGIGFIILSYYSLDGCIRVYMSTLSVGAFLVLKHFVFHGIYNMLNRFLGYLLHPCIMLLRILFVPLVYIYRRIYRNSTNYPKKNLKVKESYHSDTIDKAEEKC